MRDLIIGLIGGILLGAVGFYVVTQNSVSPNRSVSTPGTQPVQVTNPNKFQGDYSIPYPFNLPAFSSAIVTYNLNSIVEEINPGTSSTNIKVKALTGPRFTDPISIPNTLAILPIATSSATKLPNKTIKDIKVGDQLNIDLSYNPKTKKTYPSLLQYTQR